jgi:hypothetical protein
MVDILSLSFLFFLTIAIACFLVHKLQQIYWEI